MMSHYSDWKLDDLKKELRKRQVKVSGKKTELVERLTYLDSVGRRGTEPEPGSIYCCFDLLVYIMSMKNCTKSARTPQNTEKKAGFVVP